MTRAQAKQLTRRELVEKGTTIGAIQMRGILAGKSTEAILADVKKKYPKAATTAACVAYYRTALRKSGWAKVPEPARAPAPAVVKAPAKPKAKKGARAAA